MENINQKGETLQTTESVGVTETPKTKKINLSTYECELLLEILETHHKPLNEPDHTQRQKLREKVRKVLEEGN